MSVNNILRLLILTVPTDTDKLIESLDTNLRYQVEMGARTCRTADRYSLYRVTMPG